MSVHWFKNHSCSCKHYKNALCGKVYLTPGLKTVLEVKLLSAFVLLLYTTTTSATTNTSTTYWEILLEQKNKYKCCSHQAKARTYTSHKHKYM